MPLTKYCPSCAFPNQYTLDMPKFCGGCRAQLSEQVSIASTVDRAPQTKQIKRPIVVAPEPEIEEIDDSVLAIEPLESNMSKGIKFGVLAEQKRSDWSAPTRNKGKKVNTKKIIEELRKEAGLGGSKSHEIHDPNPE